MTDTTTSVEADADDSLDSLTYGKFIEEVDDLINDEELDEDILADGEGDGTKVKLQVFVGGWLHDVIGVAPRDDGKTLVLNISPIGLAR